MKVRHDDLKDEVAAFKAEVTAAAAYLESQIGQGEAAQL